MLVKITTSIIFLLGFTMLFLMWSLVPPHINAEGRLMVTVWIIFLLIVVAFNLYTQIKNK